MTVETDYHPTRIEPLPAGKRYGIATISSVAIHLAVLLLVGLFSLRTPAATEVFIPIELTITAQPGNTIELGLGGHPEAIPKDDAAPSSTPEPKKAKPSSPNGENTRAPAPPKVLTSGGGTDSAGEVSEGKESRGPGGEEDQPAGPTKGPGVLGGIAPIYPKDALDQGLEGRVELSVQVGADGSVSSVEVSSSSQHQVLDDAAVRAIKRGWTFEPALEDGKPITGAMKIIFEFASGEVTVDQEP